MRPNSSEAMAAEEYLNRLHAAGIGLFCDVCIVGREIAWKIKPWQPPEDQPTASPELDPRAC
jgi:hypothetical protein